MKELLQAGHSGRVSAPPEKRFLIRYMDKGVLRSLLEEHLGGVQNRRLLVWSLLNVEEFISSFSA